MEQITITVANEPLLANDRLHWASQHTARSLALRTLQMRRTNLCHSSPFRATVQALRNTDDVRLLGAEIDNITHHLCPYAIR